MCVRVAAMRAMDVIKVIQMREALAAVLLRVCLNAFLRIRLMKRNCDTLIRV